MAENDRLLGVHVAEDDDAQRIKAWWKKNGMGIVAGVVIGVVGVGGFKGWQSYTESRAFSASAVFQEMLTADEAGAIDRVRNSAETLVKKYRATPYGDLAYLMIAKLASQEGDLSGAMEAINNVMTESKDPAMRQIARLRLSQVNLLAGDLVRAYDLATSKDVGGFESEYPEALGDVLFAQYKYSEAAEAYGRALEALPPGSSSRGLLTLKQNHAGSVGNNQ